ncbi:Crp/Fnr family transcriptional regulator [Dongia soli]|uniref:Crp/Fnr family transcriptional regulator n=1 Tax=Dongia soli TaxID=600628 RepID=A0ABU5EEX8_9PROT|nr:Crp/Fnr family transcriptional regulator [Dongia soli]MDY0884771.1 Crp/Fnr family transcriptional regulator [Dongia soli]
MGNPLTMKLGHGSKLTSDDRQRLDALIETSSRIEAYQDLIREHDPPGHVRLILEGFVCRYKILENGRRSIIAYLVPGDICDLHVAILRRMDHAMCTLTPCKVVFISPETIEDLTTNYPRIARALWWATLVDAATLREWLVNLGQRPSDQRLGHLFCELLMRLQTVELADENSYHLPLTQEALADTLGISTVHVNRVLQQLREDGLVVFRDHRLIIPNVKQLKEFAGFDGNYLHLDGG